MRLKSILPAALLALPLSSFAQLGLSLSGFSTQYTYGATGDFEAYQVVAAGNPPSNYNIYWISNPPTLPGGAQTPYLLVNGGNPGDYFWSESETVTGPNETFSYYGTSVYAYETPSTAANLQLEVDGNPVGALNTMYYNSATPGGMLLFSISLAGIAPGPHTFALYDTNGNFGGNDFALAPTVTPEPASFAALGLGLIPALWRRKRAN